MGMNEHEYDNDGNGGKSKKMSSLDQYQILYEMVMVRMIILDYEKNGCDGQ